MLDYQLFEAGYCRHCEKMTLKNGRFKQREYPAMVCLIKHPSQGYILFDTGYTQRFNTLTKGFPFSLYRYLTPLTLDLSLKEQLQQKNIAAEEIRYIVISHFHADHIGGLQDFPQARFICHPEALTDIKKDKGWRALIKGFLPGLLPPDFHERLYPLSQEVGLPSHLAPFTAGYDLFNDGSLIAIHLPGHAKGQLGLYFKAQRDRFLIADSCWHQETFKDLIFPSELSYLLHHDKAAYQQTIRNLNALYRQNPDIDIIPSHCRHIRARIKTTIL